MPSEGYEGLVKTASDGQHSLSLLISGVYCALCIQKIEGALHRFDVVDHARLNFSTRRLTIQWHGSAALANEYVDAVEAEGYEALPYNPDAEKNTQDQENRFLLLCLGVAGFAMGNVMLLSVGLWSSDAATMGEGTRTFMHWISALIAIPAIAFSGRPFFRSAFVALRHGRTNMDVPIALALILSAGMSVFETVQRGEHVYFDSAVMLLFFLLIGRYLDFRARRSARGAAQDLMQSLAGFAVVKDGDKTKRMLISEVEEGMEVLVAAGEKIPVDGLVQSGESLIDTSLITGETLPRRVQVGDSLYAGTINQSAPLTLKVSKMADSSLLADIIRLMEQAEQGQSRYVRLADKAARLYTPVVHVMALAAFIVWWGFGGASWQDALLIAVTVLIITCPCALGLAVPVVQVLATGRLMKHGVLVKSGDALERLARIDSVIFDKTGTLTLGQPSLQAGEYALEDLKLAASLAAHSQHPLSRALCAAYDGALYDLDAVQEHSGQGVEAHYKGAIIRIGSRHWCGEDRESDHGGADHETADHETMELWLDVQGEKARKVCFAFKDQLRPDAADVVATLSGRGLDCMVLSGDRRGVVEHVAQELGIQSVLAEHNPADKHAALERYKRGGRVVLMVGDGLNDAPVLSGADVSMAPGSALDMAQNIADMVFMGWSLKPVALAHRTARSTQRLVKQNFALAVLYNCFAIPLAFAGLVTPMIAALAMSGSSLLVIANSYRL